MEQRPHQPFCVSFVEQICVRTKKLSLGERKSWGGGLAEASTTVGIGERF